MKRLISFILIICCCVTPFSTVAFADNTPNITVGTASANAGNTVSVPVSFINNPGINAYSLKIDYDTERLCLDSVTQSENMGGEFAYVQKAVWFSFSDSSFCGEFLTLNFKVRENAPAGEAFVSVSYNSGDICNLMEEDINFSVTAGYVKVTSGFSGSPVIKVGSAVTNAGKTITIPVSFINNPGINAYSLKIDYDTERLCLDSVTQSENMGGEFAYVQKAVWFSLSDSSFCGEFLTLNFKVPENAPAGDAFVSVSYNSGDICNLREEDIDFSVITGKITILKTEIIYGDGNGNGKIEADDLTVLITAILKSSIYNAVLDINRDGTVDILDLVKLKHHLAGKIISDT